MKEIEYKPVDVLINRAIRKWYSMHSFESNGWGFSNLPRPWA
jgi:hypothetical protein